MSDVNGDWPAEPAERVKELVEGVLDEPRTATMSEGWSRVLVNAW